MSTVVKDLGAVSAYAYAVEKGYTGTEAEFAELMADYAEVGQRAEDAAESALNSKTSAQTAATTATNKASEATTAAQTATTKAGEASTSASTATSAKDTAVSASRTATSKATEATTAAATATSAASTATTAKDDAVSAKTAAQTAQTGAETARDAVQSSAAQIAANAEDITQLKEDLTTVSEAFISSIPVIDASEWVANTNTAVTSNDDGTYSVGTNDYGTTIFGPTETLEVGDYYLFGIASDKGYTFISTSQNVSNAIATNDTGYAKKITVSTKGAYYIGMRLSAKPTTAFVATPTLIKNVNRFDIIDAEVADIESGITDLNDLKNDIIENTNVISINSQTIMHTFGDGNVTFNGNNGFSYIRVTAQNNQFGFAFPTVPKKEYDLTLKLNGIADGEVSIYVCPTSVYNTGNALASDAQITANKNVSLHFTAITAQSSLWIHVSYKTSKFTATNIVVDDGIIEFKLQSVIDYKGREISVFNKIACVGDSITEGTFNYSANGSNANVIKIGKYSYPTILEKLTGVETANLGRGGNTSVQWYSYYQNEDLSGYDAVIIMLGINDGVYTTPIADFTTAICNIIDKFKTENNGIRVFLATIIPAYTDYDTKFDAYNTELRRIATEVYSDIFLIDINLYSECKFDTYYAQGHLTAIGYRQLAEEFATMISYTIHQNPSAFRNVQFIGTEYTYTAEE